MKMIRMSKGFKRRSIPKPVTAGIVIFLLLILAWHFTPKKYLVGIASTDVVSIEVSVGSTGNSFTVTDRTQIMTIVENVHGVEMKKEKFSLGHDSFAYSLTFTDAKGKTLDTFMINSKYIVRDDPFFYRSSRALCFEYLQSLEKELLRPGAPTE